MSLHRRQISPLYLLRVCIFAGFCFKIQGVILAFQLAGRKKYEIFHGFPCIINNIIILIFPNAFATNGKLFSLASTVPGAQQGKRGAKLRPCLAAWAVRRPASISTGPQSLRGLPFHQVNMGGNKTARPV